VCLYLCIYIIKKSVSECITLSVPYPLPDD
jgi:hypothetical protein